MKGWFKMIKDIIYGVSSLLVIGFTLSTIKIRQENKKNDKSINIHLNENNLHTEANEICAMIKDLLICKNTDNEFNNKFGKYGVNINTLKDKWNQIRLDYAHHDYFVSGKADNIYKLITMSSSVYINYNAFTYNAFTINIRNDDSINLEELRDVLLELPSLIKFKKTNVISDETYDQTISAIVNKVYEKSKK